MPVSAIASAHPVTAPSRSSSCLRGQAVVVDQLDPLRAPLRGQVVGRDQPLGALLAAQLGSATPRTLVRGGRGARSRGTRRRARRTRPRSPRASARSAAGSRAAPRRARAGPPAQGGCGRGWSNGHRSLPLGGGLAGDAERPSRRRAHVGASRRSPALAPPPVPEGLLGRLGQIARGGPARQRPRQARDAALAARAAVRPAARPPAPARRRGARRRRGTSPSSPPSRASTTAPCPPPARAGAPAPAGCRSRPGRPRSRPRTGSTRTAATGPPRAP